MTAIKHRYFPDGSVQSRKWVDADGKAHRHDGPAIILYNEFGVVVVEKWFEHGREHRDNGPAIIRYNEDGSVFRQGWYLDGRNVSKEDFKSIEMIRKMKAETLFSPLEIAKIRKNG